MSQNPKDVKKVKQSTVEHRRKLKEGLEVVYLASQWSLERASQLEAVRAKSQDVEAGMQARDEKGQGERKASLHEDTEKNSPKL